MPAHAPTRRMGVWIVPQHQRGGCAHGFCLSCCCSGSTEMASHMAAAVLAAGADPSWFPRFAGGMGGGGGSLGGGGGGSGLPSLDHALQTVAASRSQHWAQARTRTEPPCHSARQCIGGHVPCNSCMGRCSVGCCRFVAAV